MRLSASLLAVTEAAAGNDEAAAQHKVAHDRSLPKPSPASASASASSASSVPLRRLLAFALLLTVLLQQAPLASCRLLHVSVVFRHGHRAPIRPLPNDNYTAGNTWRDGLGQLTNLGKRNQLELGSFLRGRYGGFFGSRYNSSEHRIRSSNIDRTLMSAQVCLAGLFPPTGDQVWKQGLDWQPIPVHTVTTNSDPLLLPHNFVGCAQRFGRLGAVARHDSPERPRMEAEMAGFLRHLSVEAGAGERPFTLDNIYKVVDTLMVLRTANLSQPAWALVPDTQHRLRILGQFSWHEFARTPELRQMRIGVLIDRLLLDMEAAAANRQPESGGGRRLTVYSGHDVTLVPLLAALGSADYAVWPNYAACLMFELHSATSNGTAGAEVKIFYRNDTGQEPLQIRVPGCGGHRLACPLNLLASLLTGCRLSPGQFSDLCAQEAGHGDSSNAASNVNNILIAIAVALPAAVLIVAAVHFCCLRSWLRRRWEESPSIAYHSLLGDVEN